MTDFAPSSNKQPRLLVRARLFASDFSLVPKFVAPTPRAREAFEEGAEWLWVGPEADLPLAEAQAMEWAAYWAESCAAARGALQSALAWPGAPLPLDLARLSGPLGHDEGGAGVAAMPPPGSSEAIRAKWRLFEAPGMDARRFGAPLREIELRLRWQSSTPFEEWETLAEKATAALAVAWSAPGRSLRLRLRREAAFPLDFGAHLPEFRFDLHASPFVCVELRRREKGALSVPFGQAPFLRLLVGDDALRALCARVLAREAARSAEAAAGDEELLEVFGAFGRAAWPAWLLARSPRRAVEAAVRRVVPGCKLDMPSTRPTLGGRALHLDVPIDSEQEQAVAEAVQEAFGEGAWRLPEGEETPTEAELLALCERHALAKASSGQGSGEAGGETSGSAGAGAGRESRRL
jgi:hypothetical protein